MAQKVSKHRRGNSLEETWRTIPINLFVAAIKNCDGIKKKRYEIQ